MHVMHYSYRPIARCHRYHF